MNKLVKSCSRACELALTSMHLRDTRNWIGIHTLQQSANLTCHICISTQHTSHTNPLIPVVYIYTPGTPLC